MNGENKRERKKEKLLPDTMDDVDRLFQCFKCGISPPPSAARERKRSKRNSKGASSVLQVSPSSRNLLRDLAGKRPKIAAEPSSISAKAKNSLNRGRQFSPVIFYGSPHGVPPKRPSRLLRLLHEIRLDLVEQDRLNLRRDIWATFPRQDDAMKFAKEQGLVRVFSYQDHFNGQRRFLVSTYKEFWRRYKNMNSKFRHHYEVIQEGLPCHLYFDLEFNVRDNMGKKGDEMVDLLIAIVFEALLEKYSIQGNHEWIVELDSSTDGKFSRHLIIRMPKTAFKDNIHGGAFVAEICSRIFSARGTDERYEKLFIKKDSGLTESACHLFVDTAVYSRNRCFRLVQSSKAGKSSVLLPTGRFKCKDMCEEDIFMASLICNMDVDCETLLVCKMDSDCVKTLHFETEVNSNVKKRPNAFPFKKITLKDYTTDSSRSCFMGKSPFPSLDVFVEAIATIGNVSGKIRSWYLFSEYGLMVYSMSRNRYCERIGREHKSNHVIYVVDLQRAAYYQKCHDPDCKGYRSPSRDVPLEAIGDITDFFNSAEINGELMHNENQLVENNQEHNFPYIMSSGKKDGWWLEAVQLAEKVEKLQKMPDLSRPEKCAVEEEDEDWWVAVERTTSQTERTYSLQ